MAIARELHIPTVVVPLFPSHFSALGMLLADERHDFIRTFYADLATADFAALAVTAEEMSREAVGSLRHASKAELQISLDLRYVGQEFTLAVPVTPAGIAARDRAGMRRAFDALYEQRYAHHSAGEPVEMVNIRVAAIGRRAQLAFPQVASGAGAPKPSRTRSVIFDDVGKPVECPVYEREALAAGMRFSGPALVQEHGTTTTMFAGDRCTVAATGELVLEVGT